MTIVLYNFKCSNGQEILFNIGKKIWGAFGENRSEMSYKNRNILKKEGHQGRFFALLFVKKYMYNQ